jgi:hypothetical protein
MAMRDGRERARILRHLPWIADLLVLELVWTQGVAILLVVRGLAAGSIAEEDRQGTMLALLASPLSSGSIILGKLAARLAQVALALATSLPVVDPRAMMGALDLASDLGMPLGSSPGKDNGPVTCFLRHDPGTWTVRC